MKFYDLRKHVLSECEEYLESLAGQVSFEKNTERMIELSTAAVKLQAMKEILIGEKVSISSLRGLCFHKRQGYVEDIKPNGKTSATIRVWTGTDKHVKNADDLHTHIDLFVDPKKEIPGA